MAATETHVKKLVVPPELKALLKEYPALRVDDKRGKVCCCLTGHEMPLREDAVRSFVQGKRFQKAQAQREYDFDQYKPHLVPNTKRGFQHTLFCTLTLRCVTRRPTDVERHVSGKRYQRALKRWQKCQETGEKFKPRGGRKQRGDSIGRANDSASDHGDSSSKGFWQSGSEDEDGDVDDDDLNDLYPSDDFASASEEEENNTTNRSQAAAENKEETSESDSDTAEAASQKAVNGQPSRKALKRKKPQKPGGKKKRT